MCINIWRKKSNLLYYLICTILITNSTTPKGDGAFVLQWRTYIYLIYTPVLLLKVEVLMHPIILNITFNINNGQHGFYKVVPGIFRVNIDYIIVFYRSYMVKTYLSHHMYYGWIWMVWFDSCYGKHFIVVFNATALSVHWKLRTHNYSYIRIEPEYIDKQEHQ